eukprot:TRINITY_DN18253_c0_g1_i2.p1 TRINITY_DN18253_c0_g1~~TRINITY_DN18253_c0_g1_i2.p1  ORF type:complete len:514 (+),score=20.07 TRINITY_DN18253_c0_g1_i2:25-1542(+)
MELGDKSSRTKADAFVDPLAAAPGQAVNFEQGDLSAYEPPLRCTRGVRSLTVAIRLPDLLCDRRSCKFVARIKSLRKRPGVQRIWVEGTETCQRAVCTPPRTSPRNSGFSTPGSWSQDTLDEELAAVSCSRSKELPFQSPSRRCVGTPRDGFRRSGRSGQSFIQDGYRSRVVLSKVCLLATDSRGLAAVVSEIFSLAAAFGYSMTHIVSFRLPESIQRCCLKSCSMIAARQCQLEYDTISKAPLLSCDLSEGSSLLLVQAIDRYFASFNSAIPYAERLVWDFIGGDHHALSPNAHLISRTVEEIGEAIFGLWQCKVASRKGILLSIQFAHQHASIVSQVESAFPVTIDMGCALDGELYDKSEWAWAFEHTPVLMHGHSPEVLRNAHVMLDKLCSSEMMAIPIGLPLPHSASLNAMKSNAVSTHTLGTTSAFPSPYRNHPFCPAEALLHELSAKAADSRAILVVTRSKCSSPMVAFVAGEASVAERVHRTLRSATYTSVDRRVYGM